MKHTDREYEAELQRVFLLVASMGQQLADILGGTTRALAERDVVLAGEMIAADQEINRAELAVDALCMQVLALRQPVANDLRFIMTVLKLVTDLERIGDLAKNVCQRVVELSDSPPRLGDGKLGTKLVAMMDHARQLTDGALRAFAERDLRLAAEVREGDDQLDTLYREFLSELLTAMRGEPDSVFEATRLQSTAKYIERIGDHATNVAEMVVFLVKGEDVRHPLVSR